MVWLASLRYRDMEREELIDLILAARSPEEIDRVFREASAYLEDHPDDVGIRSALEQPYMIRSALIRS